MNDSIILAHAGIKLLKTVNSGSSFPVFGTIQNTLAFILVAGILIGCFYWLLNHIKKSKSKFFSDAKEIYIAKLILVLIVIGAFATSWDIWWHRAVGRDSLFVPPHILLYSVAIVGVLSGIYVFLHSKNEIWRRITLAFLMIPITAPFDNLWHLMFGVEDLSRPTSIAWAPPHVALNLAVFVIFISLLKVIYSKPKVKDQDFFGSVIFGMVFILLGFFILPFHPTEGWGQVAGFWGAGATPALMVATIMIGQKWIRSGVAATSMMLLAIVIMVASYGEELAEGVVILPHDRAPIWLGIFAYLPAAVLLDLTKNKLDDWLRGIIAGGWYTGVLFGFSSMFFTPEFQYSGESAAIALISGLLGGALGVAVYKYYIHRKPGLPDFKNE